MDKLFTASVALLLLSFAGAYWLAGQPGSQFSFQPPYAFAVGDPLSMVTAFAFAFLFSLLFFGYSAPLAMIFEGVKYGYLYARGGMPFFDLFFAVPAVFACYSAILLGRSAWDDFKGTGSLFKGWRRAFKYFMAGAVLLGFLLLARRFF